MAQKWIYLSIFGGVVLVISELVWHLIKKYRNNLQLTDNKKTISEVLLFSDASKYCRNHAFGNPCNNECPAAKLKQLISYLDSSMHTLDICMYVITCQSIAEAIIRAQRRRVDVRIIVDAGMAENEACANKLNQMRDAGVLVRMARSADSLMHHKFGIIDQKIMIYGSTNWTMQAFFGNFDGIIITNQAGLVKPLIIEFNRIWEEIK
ncbi:mitochondrial cardiolipin hydrolase [Chelonus insularis]|uniref:mitochondrial cardiolipin hydrolase n=1 Tax=Chelonus insularis TaxID=460826 RepID=UPI001588FF92|nr:mitochondrial cardiolipin hydrolase [Chelonus insularis]